MLVVTSPAKRLDWDPVDVDLTQPDLQDEAVKLVKTARNLTLGNLQKLMDLSPDLARSIANVSKPFRQSQRKI